MSFRDSIKSERLEDVETLSYENNPMIFDEKNAKIETKANKQK